MFDITGVHKAVIRICACGSSVSLPTQLLRARLFPATSKMPETAFTFAALNLFQLLNLEARTNAYDYHSVLRKLTDNVIPDAVEVRHRRVIVTY